MYQGPVGRALLGRVIGDEVAVELPNGGERAEDLRRSSLSSEQPAIADTHGVVARNGSGRLSDLWKTTDQRLLLLAQAGECCHERRS